jgi:uncharacterized protein
MYPKGNLFIPSPHGQIEAIYRPPHRDFERVALVCHPHPLFAGTMHNKVVYRAAQAFEEAGFAVMRFNFRGVGQSTGVHDDGRGEVEDARLALEHLLEDQPRAKEIVVAGFSFGAGVGLRLGCAHERVTRLTGIGTSMRLNRLEYLDECTKPKLFIHGEHDELASLAALESRLAELPSSSPWRLVVIKGAGHFFDGQLDEVKAIIKAEMNG